MVEHENRSLNETDQSKVRTRNRIAGVIFLSDQGYGLDILLQQGRVKVFPGPVYFTEKERFDRALPQILEQGIELQVNFQLETVKVKDSNNLVEKEGWISGKEYWDENGPKGY